MIYDLFRVNFHIYLFRCIKKKNRYGNTTIIIKIGIIIGIKKIKTNGIIRINK